MSGKIFLVNCIDFRYDYLVCNYLTNIGYRNNYYNGTTAGAALPLGYKCYCKTQCKNKEPKCDPINNDIQTLKQSLDLNINISKTLSPITEVYLLDHQDCGAFKAFLPCSGYPDNLGDDNEKEIKIHKDVLIWAKKYIQNNFENVKVRMGLIDYNGTVSDLVDGKCICQYKGPGKNPKGLWYNKC